MTDSDFSEASIELQVHSLYSKAMEEPNESGIHASIVDSRTAKKNDSRMGRITVKHRRRTSLECYMQTRSLTNRKKTRKTKDRKLEDTKLRRSGARKRETRTGVKDEYLSGKKSRTHADFAADCPASFASGLDPDPVSDDWELQFEDLGSLALPPSGSRESSFTSEIALDLRSLMHRCTVRNVFRRSDCLVLLLSECTKNKRIFAMLFGLWKMTKVQEGDIVNVIGTLHEHKGSFVVRIDSNEGFLIVHPDVLVPVTRLPLGNACQRRGYLQQWMVEHWDTASEKAVFGNIMHGVVQVALKKYIPYNGEPLELQEDMNEIIQKASEELFKCEKTEADAVQFVQEGLPLLKSWLEAYATSKSNAIQVQEVMDVEESICAPYFGLKGRIDATVNVRISGETKDRKSNSKSSTNVRGKTSSSATIRSGIGRHLTSLKQASTRTGTKEAESKEQLVPLEFKTGKRWQDHDAQVLLYFLLMQTRYNQPIEEGLLWYLNSPAHMNVITMDKILMDGIFQSRNDFVRYLNKLETELPPMEQHARVCEKCPFLTDCTILHKVTPLFNAHNMVSLQSVEQGTAQTSRIDKLFTECTDHVTERYSSFLRRWLRTVDGEAADIKKKERLSWNPDKTASKAAGVLNMTGLILKDVYHTENGWIYIFRDMKDQDRFRKGEFVLASIEEEQPGILKGFIQESSEDTVVVLADDPLPKNWRDSSYRWRLDRFYSTKLTSNQRTNLLELIGSQDPSISRLRSLIIDHVPPQKRQDADDVEDAVLRPFKVDLNPDQRVAAERVWDEYEYSLIWGMPGSGKTHTTVHAIRGLIRKNRSILITSYTHSAVDNILSKLKDSGVHFLRLGAKVKVDESIHEYLLGSPRFPDTSTSALKTLMDEIQVVGVTCSAARHPLLNSKRFDVCIVDEASQISLPDLLGPLLKAKSFVLVGDPKQLPPSKKQRQALAPETDETLFSILQKAHPEDVAPLRMQYRMCHQIMDLANHLVYNNELISADQEVTNQMLDLPNFNELSNLKTHNWCQEILNPERHVLMVDTGSLDFHDQLDGESCINIQEAVLVVDLVSALLDFGLSKKQLGIISPYNGQNNKIEALLEDAGYCDLEVSTVDRFQGRDKDCMIFSFVRSNQERNTGMLLTDWRRMNVAITRARKKLILIGDSNTLSTDPFLQRVIEYLQRKHCITTINKAKS